MNGSKTTIDEAEAYYNGWIESEKNYKAYKNVKAYFEQKERERRNQATNEVTFENENEHKAPFTRRTI